MDRDHSLASSSAKLQVFERWVHRRLGRIEHERRVLNIAQTLFSLTQPLHELGTADLRLLQMGSLVHDVGRKISDKRHPTVGARMLEQDRFLPVSDEERRGLCYLTRYHRGAVPKPGYDEILVNGDNRKRMLLNLALLRAADSLDNRQLTPPRLIFALRGRRLHITCYVEEPSARARKAFRRRKKFRLLEELLDCRIEVEVVQADAVHAVA